MVAGNTTVKASDMPLRPPAAEIRTLWPSRLEIVEDPHPELGALGVGSTVRKHDLTLNLPNQGFDPSAASAGTGNLDGTLTINPQQTNNSGRWAMPGNSIGLNAAQDMANIGTISKEGDIILSTNGTF